MKTRLLIFILVLCAANAIVVGSFAQTILISGNASGGFENGPPFTFASNFWSVANGPSNNWVLGTGSIYSGTRGAYIGNATTFIATNTPSINHLYRSTGIAIPAGATNVTLAIRYRQPTIGGDTFIVAATPTVTPTPTAGMTLNSSYQRLYTNVDTVFTSYTKKAFDLSSFAGSTIRIAFTYVNNGIAPAGAVAIDSVSVSYYCLPPITGTNIICSGNTTTLACATTGGIWTSAAPSIATIGSSTGIVTGVSAGTCFVTYTLGSCEATAIVTVNPIPAVITGLPSCCIGTTTTLSSTTTGCTWSSSDISTASIGSASGVVTGIAIGTTTITCVSPNGCSRTIVASVNPAPTPITGNSAICLGATSPLSSFPSGGVWSSSNVSRVTVDPSGVITGVSVGTSNITYSFGTCRAVVTVSVNAVPPAIGGASSVCVGATTVLTEAATGIWSSSNAAIGTISATASTFGVVGGISSGVITITYTALATGCNTTKSITVNSIPTAGTITGASTLSVGANTTLSNSVPGGIWSSSNTAIATVSATGVVTGNSIGNANVSYTVTNSCGSISTILNITVVTPLTTPITGSLAVCVGATTSLSNATSGGIWSSSAPSVATITTGGVISGIGAGTSIISYTLFGASVTVIVTVNEQPSAITGSSDVCIGSSVLLSNSSASGSWTSSAPSVLLIDIAGNTSGLSLGTGTISYMLPNGCYSTLTMSVNPPPSASILSGIGICPMDSAAMIGAPIGGTWTSGNPTIALVNSYGLMTGIAAGTITISYSVANMCGIATATVVSTVNPLPSAGVITGAGGVCLGASISLSNSVTGGLWSSSTTNASVSAGVVTGLLTGTTVISYAITNSCGTDVARHPITVVSSPSAGVVLGPTSVCIGSTIALFPTITGGTWSISNAHASLSSAGIVTGISAGVDTITYTVTFSCGSANTRYIVTINPLPFAGNISGSSNVCVGSAISFSSTVPGGIWYGGNSIAHVFAGTVTGSNAGTITVSYSVTSMCTGISTKIVTVNALPATGTITGPAVVCLGNSIALTNTVSGGVWSTMHPSVVSVNTSGSVTGMSGGVGNIRYTVNDGTCTSSTVKSISVNTPSTITITGPSDVCVGASIVLGAPVGGTWSLSNPSASMTGSVLYGLTVGVDTVTYTLPLGGCINIAKKIVSIRPVPSAGTISGPDSVCVGSTITLSETVSGGIWSSSSPSATISTSGVVTGISAGAAIIQYYVNNGWCSASKYKNLVVKSPPATITISGPSAVCTGSAITLAASVAGGTWTASNGNAIVSGGIVTGISAGIDTIRYIQNGVCMASGQKIVTVKATPDAGVISGPDIVCIGNTISLTNTVTGGIWSKTNNKANVSGGTVGSVTGVSVGVDTIIFTKVISGCSAMVTKVVTINPAVNAGTIVGSSMVCVGSTITLSNSVGGGVWSTSNANATVVGGVVTGISSGVVTISYTIPGTCNSSVTKLINVTSGSPNAGNITGSTILCIGTSYAFRSSGVVGGVWSSSLGKVNVTGNIITGLFPGVDTILYTVTNGCVSKSARKIVTINPVPASDFSYVKDLFKVNFFRVTGLMGSSVWNYGDLSTETTVTNPYYEYQKSGNFNACLTITKDGCLRETCKPITITYVAVQPNNAANAGAVTVDIIGRGFGPSTTFALKKVGQSDVTSDTLIVINEGNIRTTLNLKGVAIGPWDVHIVTSTDTFILKNGFDIRTTNPSNHDINITIAGGSILRPGQIGELMLTIDNQNETDINMTPIILNNLPLNSTIEYYDRFLSVDKIPVVQELGINHVKEQVVFPNDNYTSSFTSIIAPRIKATSVLSIPIRIRVPSTTPVPSNNNISASVTEPLQNVSFQDNSNQPNYTNVDYEKCMSGGKGRLYEDIKEVLGYSSAAGQYIDPRIPILTGAASCGMSIGSTLVQGLWYAYESAMDVKDPLIKYPELVGAGIELITDCAGIATSKFEKEEMKRTSLKKLHIEAFKNDGTDILVQFGQQELCNKIAKRYDVDIRTVQVAASYDPNQKYGPGGGSTAHYTINKKDFAYTIGFENLPAATLPAQTVLVTDTIEMTDFLYSSFGFTSVTIGDSALFFSDKPQSFIRDIDFTATMGVKVRAMGNFETINAHQGVAKWVFFSIDPATNQQTTNPALGFLPPNTPSGNGQGYVSYIIRTLATHRDTVHNQATIIFDNNAPIITNDWACVIDTAKPASYVEVLQAISTTDSFVVSWTGKDNFSGIRSYDVYVSQDNSEYVPWLSNWTDTFALFVGKNGSSYRFFSIATDSAGNEELAPKVFDAQTRIVRDTTVTGANVRIYPNPVGSVLFIDAPALVNVVIYSIEGRRVFANNLVKNIDVRDLPDGIYIIKIFDSKNKLVKVDKFVKRNDR